MPIITTLLRLFFTEKRLSLSMRWKVEDGDRHELKIIFLFGRYGNKQLTSVLHKLAPRLPSAFCLLRMSSTLDDHNIARLERD
jgi:hypothetical protein